LIELMKKNSISHPPKTNIAELLPVSRVILKGKITARNQSSAIGANSPAGDAFVRKSVRELHQDSPIGNTPQDSAM